MLRWKKVLFTIDDVNHQEQLEFLVGEPEWLEVQLLSENEALELFSRLAFREKSPKEGFLELSRQVVKYAGRLPLALKVLGSSFYRRDKKHWRHIIDRLKRIPLKDILEKLRLSFDGLDKDEKELFLDIAFLENADLSRYDIHLYVKSVLRDLSRGFLVDCLVEKSLLSIYLKTIFVMHNMIREMGENVIREEYANSRIWLPEEVCDLFTRKLITEKVESLLNIVPVFYFVAKIGSACLLCKTIDILPFDKPNPAVPVLFMIMRYYKFMSLFCCTVECIFALFASYISVPTTNIRHLIHIVTAFGIFFQY
ncbi:TMV resistance protein N-like [Solanum tuberosum]|uniref:TMV resistance protein N-like n=1 Tax=Solanum tuberosum TaxID=4113 RepID=UPI000739FAAF|nr:PREDICTED: TMV resistance protein N-like [Solanum tuberosum]